MAECSITVRSLLYCSCHQLPMEEIAHSISKLQTGHVSSPGCTLARDVGAFGDQEIKEASDGGFQMFSRGLPENHVEHSLRIETWAVLHSCAIFKRPKFGNSIFTHTDTHTHTHTPISLITVYLQYDTIQGVYPGIMPTTWISNVEVQIWHLKRFLCHLVTISIQQNQWLEIQLYWTHWDHFFGLAD